MKHLTFFLFTLITLTSCLGSSDDNDTLYHTLTSSEKATIIQKIRKSYTGTLKYVNDSSRVDSIPTTLDFVNDSVAMINFPVSIFANYLTGSDLDSARVALQNAPARDLECLYYLPSSVLTQYWTDYYQAGDYFNIFFYPRNETLQFTAGKHTYLVTFCYTNMTYQASYYSYEVLYPAMEVVNNNIYAYILLTSIKVDNGYTYTINKPTEFKGTAK